MEVLVRALIDQDRGTEAVPFARKMVKRRSKRVPYRLLLGDALLMTGDEAGARREWQAALELDPKDRQVRMRLGHVASSAVFLAPRARARLASRHARRSSILAVRAARRGCMLESASTGKKFSDSVEAINKATRWGQLGQADAAGRSDLPRRASSRRTRTGASRSRSPTAK